MRAHCDVVIAEDDTAPELEAVADSAETQDPAPAASQSPAQREKKEKTNDR